MDNDFISMKPLLGLAIQEAVKRAILDCMPPESTDEERLKWLWDLYSIPEAHWAQIDPGALARNVVCRLLGTGGWQIGKMYAGNATPREILEACVERPDQDPLGDIKMDLGLREASDE